MAVALVDDEAGNGFQVQIYANGIEMTAKGAGLGMDPYEVLVPINRFEAREEPHVVPVARCGCGVYGCGMTDALIVRTNDAVRWEWQAEAPMKRPLIVEAEAYDKEITRIANDHSWETPDRTAGRLLLTALGSDDLPSGLRFDWVANDWQDPSKFEVCLQVPGTHQIFLSFDWLERKPEALAAEVCDVLTTIPPDKWTARWSAMGWEDGPPAVAGPDWTCKRF